MSFKDLLSKFFQPDLDGIIELEFQTAEKSKFTANLPDLTDGLKLKLKGSNTPDVELQGEYKRKNLSATLGGKVGILTPFDAVVQASIAAGSEGYALGGFVECNPRNQELKKYQLGFRYEEKNLVVVIQSKKDSKFGLVEGGFFNKWSDRVSTAARFTFEPKLVGSRELSLGLDYKLDKKTRVRGVVNTKGDVVTSVNHSLCHPKLKFGLTGASNGFAFNRVGLELAFGDRET